MFSQAVNRIENLLDRWDGWQIHQVAQTADSCDEDQFVVLWSRLKGEERVEWVTHTVLIDKSFIVTVDGIVTSPEKDRSCMIWGHYFFNERDAYMDYAQRVGKEYRDVS